MSMSGAVLMGRPVLLDQVAFECRTTWQVCVVSVVWCRWWR